MDKDNGKPYSLENLQVRDVLPNRTVVALKSSETISEALVKFQTNLIISAPVIMNHATTLDGFLGFIDVIDCIGHLVRTAQSSSELKNDDLEQLWHRNIQFSTQTVGAAVNANTKQHCCPIDAPILYAISIFARRIHRVAVYNESGIIVRVLSQADVVKYLSKNPLLLPISKAPKTPLDLNIVTDIKKIVTVYKTDKTIDAFKKMLENSVSAVTVLKKDGTVFSQLSASDLRNLGISNEIPLSIRSLMKTVGEFIELVRAATNTTHSLISATPTTPISEIIKTLAESEVHRIWIKDGDEIKGVVSLTDLMKPLVMQ